MAQYRIIPAQGNFFNDKAFREKVNKIYDSLLAANTNAKALAKSYPDNTFIIVKEITKYIYGLTMIDCNTKTK